MIFGLLGTPTEDDKSFVTDQKAIDYLDTFGHMDRCNLSDRYQGAPPEAIDFLDKIL
jgi:mitogen-activated protein kinase 1/3